MSISVVYRGFAVLALIGLCACNKNAAEAESAPSESDAPKEETGLSQPDESEERYFVEGVAGGVMVRSLDFEAEVVSVDQESREAVLRGPNGNEVTVKVGEGAVNLYQVEAGDRVHVTTARELVVYVEEEADGSSEEPSEDGTAAVVAGAAKGETPAGGVIATSKVTSTIKAMDLEARTATLAFADGEEETFEVRSDVDMTKYQVGQKVVFLITDVLAVEVKKL